MDLAELGAMEGTPAVMSVLRSPARASGRPLRMLCRLGEGVHLRQPTNEAVRGRWLKCRALWEGEAPQLDSSFSQSFEKASLTAGEKIAPVPLADHCGKQRVLLLAEAEVHPAVKYLKCKNPRAPGGGEKTEATSEEMQAALGVEETVGRGVHFEQSIRLSESRGEKTVPERGQRKRASRTLGQELLLSLPRAWQGAGPPGDAVVSLGSLALGEENELRSIKIWCQGILLLPSHVLQKDEESRHQDPLPPACFVSLHRPWGPSLPTLPCFWECTSSSPTFSLLSGHPQSEFSILCLSCFLIPTPRSPTWN